LKPTSIFIPMTMMEVVVRKTLLRDLAALWPSRSYKTLWAQRTWWLSMPQWSVWRLRLDSPTISLVIALCIYVHVWCCNRT
jgi:hypothetical protein